MKRTLLLILSLIIVAQTMTACNSMNLHAEIDRLNAEVSQLQAEKQVLENQKRVSDTKIADLKVMLDSSNATITKLHEKPDAVGKVLIAFNRNPNFEVNSREWGWWEGYAEVGGVDVTLNQRVCRIYDSKGNIVYEYNTKFNGGDISANRLLMRWRKISIQDKGSLFTVAVYGEDANGNQVEAYAEVNLVN